MNSVIEAGADKNLTGKAAESPELFTVVFGAAGSYTMVAIMCLLAGYTLKNRDWPSYQDILLLIPCILLLFPYFFHREGLLEHQLIRRELKDNGEATIQRKRIDQLSIILFGGALIVSYLISHIAFNEVGGPPVGSPDYTLRYWYWAKLFTAVIPFFVLAVWTRRGWPRQDNRFFFKYRTFFPALATCLIPFMYGWSSYGDASGTMIAAFFVLSLFVVSLKFLVSDKILILTSAVYVLVLFIVAHLLKSDTLYVLTFGIVLTVAMGVSEAWRISRRVLDGVEYIPNNTYISPKRVYQGGTNLATALVPLLLPFTYLHPATKGSYFYIILVFIIAQVAYWFCYGWKSISRARWGGFFFGCGLPAIICVMSNYFPDSADSFQMEISRVDRIVETLGVGFSGIMFTLFLVLYEREFILGNYFDFVHQYVIPKRCFDLILCVSTLLALNASVVWFFLLTRNMPMDLYLTRLYQVILAYVGLSYLLGWIIVPRLARQRFQGSGRKPN